MKGAQGDGVVNIYVVFFAGYFFLTSGNFVPMLLEGACRLTAGSSRKTTLATDRPVALAQII